MSDEMFTPSFRKLASEFAKEGDSPAGEKQLLFIGMLVKDRLPLLLSSPSLPPAPTP